MFEADQICYCFRLTFWFLSLPGLSQPLQQDSQVKEDCLQLAILAALPLSLGIATMLKGCVSGQRPLVVLLSKIRA